MGISGSEALDDGNDESIEDTRPASPDMLRHFRNWLSSDLLVLRWVLLALYVVIVGGLFLGSWFGDGDRLSLLLFGILTLACQALFIIGGGTMRLSRPIRKRRLWMPALVAGLMFGLLAGGLFLALGELICLDANLNEAFVVLFWCTAAANWLFWFLLFFSVSRRRQRMSVLGRLTGALIAGSLAELLVAAASHAIVSRRPGCFVGIYTMMGILAGLHVMLFAFGPGIVLLFLRPRYRREQIEGPTEPEKRRYQFRLRTVFAMVLVVAVGSAWLGFKLDRARTNRRAADEIRKIQHGIEHLGGSVHVGDDHPDSLDELFGDPGVLFIFAVECQGNFGDAELERLKGSTELVSLQLNGTRVTDAGLANLNGLTGLDVLSLGGTQVTDAGLAHLQELTKLDQLHLQGTKITDTGLEHLGGLTNLNVLNLSRTQITDTGLKHLKGRTRLNKLDLHGTQITDAGLEHLKELNRLQQLHLHGTQISDAGLEHLRALTGLDKLNLGGTRITDAGLEHLKGLTKLRQLDLHRTTVTDVGLEHLDGLSQLRWLGLRDTQVTDAGVEKFQEAVPANEIVR